MNTSRVRSLTLGCVALCVAIAAPAPAQTASKFELDATAAREARLGYFPVPVKILSEKPAGVKKEPTYAGTPKYGVFKVGNGPQAEHYLALDEPGEPGDGKWKIYVDLKGDGDLTSGGDGAWSKFEPTRKMFGVNKYLVRASYGTSTKETVGADYGLAFYRFAERDVVFMYREAARKGTVTIDGKEHKALLVENDADGLFAKPVDDKGKAVAGGATTRPVWLLIDEKDDGKWGPQLDARGPIKLGKQNYLAEISPDGATIQFTKTDREAPKAPERKELLAKGAVAPDFTALSPDGKSFKLSDLKGKVVLLDFWATWCGPCQKAMPHVEKIYQETKGQDIVVLGLCVWDDESKYTKWLDDKKDTYHFKFAFDPAGKKNAESIASTKYGVNGIPTTYLIDKDGKIAASTVGYDEESTVIADALGKLGIKAAGSQ